MNAEQMLAERNYWNDHRVRAGMVRGGAFDAEAMTLTFGEPDEYIPMEGDTDADRAAADLHGQPIPARFEVCDTCRGRGSHVDPNIDAGGVDAETFGDDPDFAEAYMRREYDVPCAACGGARVTPTVDETRATPEQIEFAKGWIADQHAFAAECAAERAMGA